MKILSIDTSCDETACAVTDNTKILSNVIWSQASAHAKFGGVMPSLARRMHEERIDFVVEKALKSAFPKTRYTIYDIQHTNIDCIAVTVGPGLSIALGVGIKKANELARKYNKKLIAVNHLEGHLLSPFVNSKFQMTNIKFPMLGLVVSGGNTLLIKINKIGEYEVLAQTVDDALGEALDKGARMLGLGYPGGAVLEKMARLCRASARQARLATQPRGDIYTLPIPIIGQEDRKIFTYSGLKTAMSRKIEGIKKGNGELTKDDIYNLSASFQNSAFTHLTRVISYILSHSAQQFNYLLVGGGVSANIELRKRLRNLAKKYGLKTSFPYSKKLTGDNAAMIGVTAHFKAQRGEFTKIDKIDRQPNMKI